MSISFQNALGIYESALSLRAERAAVLSDNLANANTPMFKARDIDFKQALSQRMGSAEGSVRMRSTHAGHIGIEQPGGSMAAEKLYRLPTQPSIDGNTVEEHVEHAEYMKNSLEFQTAFTFLNSRFKGMTKALSGQ